MINAFQNAPIIHIQILQPESAYLVMLHAYLAPVQQLLNAFIVDLPIIWMDLTNASHVLQLA
jgi:hypothetical protein